MTLDLSHTNLKSKQREIRNGFPEGLGLRVHRALIWLGRAETLSDDNDAQFVFLWIAFNAAYAREDAFHEYAATERTVYTEFFSKLVSLDDEQRIYDAIWKKFSGPIRSLMSNRFIFSAFWHHFNGKPGFEDWERRFVTSSRAFTNAIQAQDSAQVLSKLFERLYVLRNQLIHGGSTWKSSANREQVRDGAVILSFLVPVFIDIMMDHPGENWGQPYYPVVEN
uniref:HEPN domain-containing protein n=1 Tax=Ruegeria arenilitoris TaxID=1173585 RepID=UPI0014807B7F|nr:HEPN domain-containing protein [Ruegeria arenilitoris]